MSRNRTGHYGVGMFLLDLLLTIVTGGLWLLVILYRIIQWFRKH